MFNQNRILKVALVYIFTSLALASIAQNNGLQNFNNDWLFTETDSPEYSLTSYNPENWRKLDLPHDWTIEHGFSEELEGATGFTPGGIGWYSKIFNPHCSPALATLCF